MSKKRKEREVKVVSGEELARRYPYETEYADHFETPLRAFADIAPLLERLGGPQSARAQVRVLDPYHCEGAAQSRLRSLGFKRARNPREDFYKSDLYRAFEEEGEGAAFRGRAAASYDVLVTNPPYSSTHKERILALALASGRPWCLLLPAYVAEKAYYTTLTEAAAARPFFVQPRRRYDFDHVLGAGHDHSHFESVWFVDAGEPRRTEALFRHCAKLGAYGEAADRSLRRHLADLKLAGAVRAAKRPNPRQRKKMKMRREAAA